jgi:hypothetical protein
MLLHPSGTAQSKSDMQDAPWTPGLWQVPFGSPAQTYGDAQALGWLHAAPSPPAGMQVWAQ